MGFSASPGRADTEEVHLGSAISNDVSSRECGDRSIIGSHGNLGIWRNCLGHFTAMVADCNPVLSQLWIPAVMLSSPIWVTLVVLAALATVSTVSVTTLIVLLFAWPEEWLPGGNSEKMSPRLGTAQRSHYHPAVAGFLRTRQAVEAYVRKVQVKLLLYAAGVGPAADVAFGIADRIDLGAVRERLAQVNVQRLKQWDVSELQALVLEAMRAVMS